MGLGVSVMAAGIVGIVIGLILMVKVLEMMVVRQKKVWVRHLAAIGVGTLLFLSFSAAFGGVALCLISASKDV